MDDTLIFEGKKFISARRASQKYHYSMDYIGQLARGGKVDSRLVGRTWYVAENSLLGYKNSRAPVEVPITVVHDAKPLPDLKPVWALLVVLLVLSFSFYSYQPQVATAQNETASLWSAIGDKIYEWWVKIVAFFVREDKYVFQKTETLPIVVNQQSESPSGLVVVPSTGVDSRDDQIVNKVKQSFSDEVAVTPDESGVSGIIRPIFRNSFGEDYLYVLVPVNR